MKTATVAVLASLLTATVRADTGAIVAPQSRFGMQARCDQCNPGFREQPLLQKVWGFGAGKKGHWDPRWQIQPSKLGPVQAVGMLESTLQTPSPKSKGILEITGTTTATLITQCHILVSGHAAYKFDLKKPYQSWTFYAGDQQKPVSAHLIANGSGNSDKRVHVCATDWEVLRLDQCVGDEYGWLPLRKASMDYVTNQDFVSVGYPKGFDTKKGLVLDPKCSILGPLKGWSGSVATDCTSDEGDSGGPILSRSSYPEIVGIQCAAGRNDKKGFWQDNLDESNGVVNVVTPIETAYDQIAEIINRPEEQNYIRAHSSLNIMPIFGRTHSIGGPKQRAPAPDMPDLDPNPAGKTKDYVPSHTIHTLQ